MNTNLDRFSQPMPKVEPDDETADCNGCDKTFSIYDLDRNGICPKCKQAKNEDDGMVTP